jgi:hypothetical protein
MDQCVENGGGTGIGDKRRVGRARRLGDQAMHNRI